MAILHGVSVSPFVRKVLVTLLEKSVEFEHRIVLPAEVDDDYRKISPLGKIPCFQDGDYTVPDSSAIIAYLERVYPEPALYPADAKDYGRALWYEEYADTKVAMTVLVPFFEFVVKPQILKKDPDKARVEKAMTEDYPGILDYLEAELGDKDWFVGSQFSIADIAITTHFVNFQYARQSVDASRWPKMSGFLKRALERPSFKEALSKDQAFFSGKR
jgi:glutathione S-transferase